MTRFPEEAIRSLNDRALTLLDAVFSQEENFPNALGRYTQGGPKGWGVAPRQILIGLMGLEKLRSASICEVPRFPRLQESLLADNNWVGGAGDLGLLAWFTAVCTPERLGNLFNQFDFQTVLERQVANLEIDTTGIALFLAGVSHARIAEKAGVPDLCDAALMAYQLLQKNQGESGIFCQSSLCWKARSLIHSRFGRFNDQMYSIYALCMFARAYRLEEPLALALGCGNAICSTQGEHGEWWFRYDKRTSRVVKRYPLFPLQQEGTAPLALGTLSESCKTDFRVAIMKGIAWSQEFARTSSNQTQSATLAGPRLDQLGWTLYASNVLGMQSAAS
ncbi:MAG: hypothetical protein JSS69_03440 [Acidobacteria bacterium]|nr:hypothetical protein [Acidobacteriota bacterium]MBS1864947.1 hypothetical protein [Acidobacteriota bacterium]